MTNGEKLIRRGLQEEGLLDKWIELAEFLRLSLVECLRVRFEDMKQVQSDRITMESRTRVNIAVVEDKSLVRWPYLSKKERMEHESWIRMLESVFPKPFSEETIEFLKEFRAQGGLYDDYD